MTVESGRSARGENVYAGLGVRLVINATCHWTRFGGTSMSAPVLDAMRAAARGSVCVPDLLDAASRIIAKHTHAESGHVLSGCAAALMVGAAAVMTGGDIAAISRLPDARGLKNQWIARRMERRRAASGEEYVHHGYAHAVRTAGGIFAEVGDDEGVSLAQIKAAAGSSTAGVYWVAARPPNAPTPEEVIALARQLELPILIDASNTLPPPEHLHSFSDAGADLVGFSGGKGLRGPQGSGFLAGRADLIGAARLQSSPVQGIGRVAKVSKEEIVGLLTAIELYVARDHKADMRTAEKNTLWLVDQLGGLINATAEYVSLDHIGRPYPTVHLALDPDAGLTASELMRLLLRGEPSIAAMGHPTDPYTIRLDVRELDERDVQRVADAVLAILMPGSVGR